MLLDIVVNFGLLSCPHIGGVIVVIGLLGARPWVINEAVAPDGLQRLGLAKAELPVNGNNNVAFKFRAGSVPNVELKHVISIA